MNIVLQQCGLNDLDSLKSLLLCAYKQHYCHLWEDLGKNYMDEQFNHNRLTHQLLDANGDFFLAKIQDTPVGVLQLQYHRGVSVYPPESCLEIRRIYLLQSHTGKGFGSDIFKFVEQQAMAKTVQVLWLMAMESGKARVFYEKHGYQVIQKKDLNHPKVIPHLKGMYLMAKHLW